MPRIALYIFLLLNGFLSLSQEMQYLKKNFSVQEGFPSSQVYRTIQDSKGYWWFSTDRGIVKFNGKDITVYDDFISPVFLSIYPDKDGGIFAYNINNTITNINAKGEIRTVSLDIGDDTRALPKVFFDFWLDDHDNFVVDFMGASFIFDPRGNRLSKFHFNQNLDPKEQLSFKHVRYLGVNDSIVCFSTNNELKIRSSSGNVMKINEDRTLVSRYKLSLGDNHRYVHNGKRIFDLEGDGSPLYDSKNEDISIIKEGKKSHLLIAHRGHGAVLFNYKTGEETRLLENCEVASFFEDSYGNLWITTLWNGAFVFSMDQRFLEMKGERFSNFDSTEGKFRMALMDGRILELKNNQIHEVYRTDHTSDFFFQRPFVIGMPNEEFLVLENSASFHVKSHERKVASVPARFGCRKNDRYWLDRVDRVFLLKKEGDDFKKYGEIKPSDYLETIFPINEDEALFGGRRHLFKVEHIKDNIFKEEIVLSDMRVVDIDRDDDRYNYFLSVRGYGIIVLDKSLNEINRLTTNGGLFSHHITQTQWNNGKLWVTSKKGVQCFSYKNNQFRLIGNFDDLYGGGEVQGIILDEKSIAIVTRKGVHQIQLDRAFQKIKENDQIRFTDFSFYSYNDGEKKEWSVSKKELNSEDNNLVFEWDLITSPFSNAPKFRYQLNADAEWVETNQLNARFYNLDAGEYSFALEFQLANGSWKHLFNKNFCVLTPWWNRWWVKLILLSVLLLFSFVGIRRFYRSGLLKRERQMEIQTLKNTALRAQMNPHFIFNALNSVQRQISEENPEEAAHYLSRFSRMIRTILENSNKDFLSFQEEMELVEQYLKIEKVRFKDRLSYAITEDDVKNKSFLIPSFSIQPIVENAIKHGVEKSNETTVVQIIVTQDENYTRVLVTNTGSEFEREKGTPDYKKGSFGVMGVHQRLNSLDSSCGIFIQKEEKGLAAVEIKLPMKELK